MFARKSDHYSLGGELAVGCWQGWAMATGKLIFNLTVSTEAMAKFANAMRKAGEAIQRFGEYHHRQEWWMRSEGPPEFIADVNEPEWWEDGDEPPPWGCAA